MSTRTRPLVFATTAAAAVGAVFVAWPMVARAFNPRPEPPARFGIVGLARGQTARLNVVNLFPPDPQSHPTRNAIVE